MLAFLTGIPGFGKTAHAIDLTYFQDSEFKELDKYVEGIPFTDEGQRQLVYYDFPKIADVKKPDFNRLSVVDENDEEAEKYMPWLPQHPEYSQFIEARATAKHPLELWFLWVTPGSVILLDEAQRLYRPRPAGSKVPLHISMLEYHRHYGVHFIFLSQAPRLVDIHLRSLIEKHIHLDKTWKGGLKYEWVKCRSVDDGRIAEVDKKEAVKSPYSPPKHVFPLYKSSSMHLKVKHKIPKAVFVFAASVPLLFILGYFVVQKVKKDHNLDHAEKAVPVVTGTLAASGVQAASGVLVDDYIKEFKPVVPGRPETAPVYKPLLRVVAVPRVASCIKSEAMCLCYSQQGSRLRDISPVRCAQILENGLDFNPYEEAQPSVQVSPQASLPRTLQGTVPRMSQE